MVVLVIEQPRNNTLFSPRARVSTGGQGGKTADTVTGEEGKQLN